MRHWFEQLTAAAETFRRERDEAQAAVVRLLARIDDIRAVS